MKNSIINELFKKHKLPRYECYPRTYTIHNAGTVTYLC